MSLFKKMKLGQKFNLVLVVVFLIGILAAGTSFAAALFSGAQDEIASKAISMMEMVNSVRNYTNTQITPLLDDRLEVESEFIPQTIPSYSAREVFESFRVDSEFDQYFYKDATLDPTNLRDIADPFEAENIIGRFREEPNLTELRGFREFAGGTQLYYIARPIQITQESCLVCHSTPDVAPPSLIETYGPNNGFGWQLDEVVGAQVLSVPSGEIFNEATRSFFLLISIAMGIYAVAMTLINLLLVRAVVRPLSRMAAIADQISTGQVDVEFNESSEDEIGILAASFNRMKQSLTMAMQMLKRSESDYGD